jgi:hypothetical protein
VDPSAGESLTSYDQAGSWFTVAGVVGDTRHTGLDSSLRPQVYVEQRVDPAQQMVVVLRATGDPLGYVTVARAAVLEADRDQPVGQIRTMKAVVTESVSNRRFTMALVATFAILAFGLSLVGLYAVVSHSVAERSREMGVRLALGASPFALLRLVLSEGLVLAGMGVAIGLFGALLMTRFMSAMLFGVTPHDALTFVTVPLLLSARPPSAVSFRPGARAGRSIGAAPNSSPAGRREWKSFSAVKQPLSCRELTGFVDLTLDSGDSGTSG